ncbi:MAG TPA: cytochrome c oxidase subunit 3 [Candidatus Paceibacterota bacterium]|nr:cytochrome c oxidase subunit 3 [Candidatus Paceibacterota bacterium]
MNNQPIQLNTEARAKDTTTLFGFWVYLMTDFVLFASLFATFAVLRTNASATAHFFDLPFVLLETIILLSSSFTCGIALLAAREGNRSSVLSALAATALLGTTFVGLEVSEFAKLAAAGSVPAASGFLSAYFTLVGTHGLHVSIGIVWMLALMIAIASKGLSRSNMRKLILLSLFWHFLDIVWIFIFTIVYLMPFV